MIHKSPLPPDIEKRLRSLGQALEQCPSILFAYLFWGGRRLYPFGPSATWMWPSTLMNRSIRSKGGWRPLER